MTNLCIIPARGGSKRIPRKNIRDFLGKPIIAYSIEAAINSGLFEEIMVSTDDNEIAEIAKHYGAKVPFMRSSENANDFATTANVIEEVLNTYQKSNRTFKNACCIYPTAPFISSERLQQGLLSLNEEDVKTVMPVVPFDFPIWRSMKKDNNGWFSFNWPEQKNVRSQDLPPSYHDAGQWYWFKVKIFMKESKLLTDSIKAIELRPLEVQDIDNEEDWKIAEIKYQLNII
jgi:pseudaminic acid cytidylyltransferase